MALRFSILLLALLSQGAQADVSFNEDVRPILAEACFHCHGPDPGTREADLRLDTEAGFFDPKSGPTVLKGKPDDSPLYQRLTTTDTDDIMPPPESHKSLKPEQIALIHQWIAEGADWQPHWSLIAPKRPDVPTVHDTDWIQTPIDAFVLKQLEASGLSPAPRAHLHTLARRISLDLTGLPPTPETLSAFVSDATTPHLHRFIDDLLASPRYGEHRARYWLDAARYGDTHGLHFDNYREMWPYRDWVVSAFNRNQPFDQFTIEQIAGDLLTDPTQDQLIATGFQRCNITTNEGGTIDEENLANYAVDRVQTLGWVYLGLTTNCAQCHDHKFDPITQKDFYSLAAFFRNTTQGAKDGNSKDGKGPVLIVPSPNDQPRWNQLPAEIAAASTELNHRRQQARPDFDQWLAAAPTDAFANDAPADALDVHLPLNEGTGTLINGTCGQLTQLSATGPVAWTPAGKLGPAPILQPEANFDLGNEGDFDRHQPFSYGAWIRVPQNGLFGGLMAKMDNKAGYRGWDLWIQDTGFAVHLVDQWSTNALKVSTRNAVVKPGEWQHVFVTYDGSGKAKGVTLYVNGVAEKMITNVDTLIPTSTFRTDSPLRLGQRSSGQPVPGASLQDLRIYSRLLKPAEVKRVHDVGPLQGILAAAQTDRTPEQTEALYSHYLATRDPVFKQHQATLSKLQTEQTTIEKRSALTHIQQEKTETPAMANLLMRGQYDQVGEAVEAAIPAAIGTLPSDLPKNRLGLAQWLVSPQNPLTARVTVNRLWQELFGTGLVTTSEDFGIMGSPPSHPELLDWLAVEFRDNGWDVKALLKLILTSATYQQAALVTPEKQEKDRDNRLLSRGPRFRMDAEMIRDYALAASGQLSTRMGGPGTKPYQPDDIWNVVGLPNGDTRNYVQDSGENLYRRTLYNFWKRMAPSPNMEIFNAPSREVCVVRRERTNTPLQALVTLNDPQFIEAARHLAEQEWRHHPNDPAAMIHALGLRVLCRPLRTHESQILLATQRDLLAHYQDHPNDAQQLLEVGDSAPAATIPPPALAAWTMVCNQLFNLDEVLTK